jgi:glyoxylate reductase
MLHLVAQLNDKKMVSGTVFIGYLIPQTAIDRLKEVAEIRLNIYGTPCPKEALIRELSEIDAIIADPLTRYDAEVINKAKKLKIIARSGVGYDNVDLNAATTKGIYVTITPNVLNDAVAELTVGLMLCLTRRLCEANEYVKSGAWTKGIYRFPSGVDLCEKTLGIIGLGGIGIEVVRRATALKMHILYYDIIRKPDVENLFGVQYCSLEDLLDKSDIVTIHASLNPKTEKLIGHAELSLMKPTAYLINMSRGKIIDQKALWEALKKKLIAGAALDVFEIEPIPSGEPLFGFDNIILTPHIGSLTVETRTKMALMATGDVIRVLKGEIPVNVVNKEILTRQQ